MLFRNACTSHMTRNKSKSLIFRPKKEGVLWEALKTIRKTKQHQAIRRDIRAMIKFYLSATAGSEHKP